MEAESEEDLREIIDELKEVKEAGGRMLVHLRHEGLDFSFVAVLREIRLRRIIIQSIPSHLTLARKNGVAVLTSRLLEMGIHTEVEGSGDDESMLSLRLLCWCRDFSGMREMKRIYYDDEVETSITIDGNLYSGLLLNLSEGGIAVQIIDKAVLGESSSEAAVRFYIPHKRWDPTVNMYELFHIGIQAQCRVVGVHRNQRGVAMRFSFVDIDFSLLAVIKRFILKREMELLHQLFDAELHNLDRDPKHHAGSHPGNYLR